MDLIRVQVYVRTNSAAMVSKYSQVVNLDMQSHSRHMRRRCMPCAGVTVIF